MYSANFTIVGRLTQDVEIRQGQNNKSFAIIKIATDDKYRNSQTQQQEKKTYFHSLICFKENLLSYLSGFKKGNLVHITGNLKPVESTDSQGNKSWIERLEVVDAQNFGGGNSSGNGQNYNNQQANNQGQGYAPQQNNQPANNQGQAPQQNNQQGQPQRNQGYNRNQNQNGQGYNQNQNGQGYNQNQNGQGYNHNQNGQGYNQNQNGQGYNQNQNGQGYNQNQNGQGYQNDEHIDFDEMPPAGQYPAGI